MIETSRARVKKGFAFLLKVKSRVAKFVTGVWDSSQLGR